MAQVSIAKAVMILFAIAMMLSATTTGVSAQEISPAPSPDVGSAFTVPLPSVMIVSSLILSVLALVKH